jgi:ParB family transcriptional regulator, chromosome partitioning protein
MSAKEAGPRLGRGLAALMGEAATRPPDTQVPQTGTRAIGIDMLDPGPFQPRGPIDAAALAELTDSIRARGVLQPLLVRVHPGEVGRYQIIAGERRWRAAAAAGLHEVPALVRSLSDIDAMAAALVENLQREDLNAIEEALGYARLVDEFGMTQDGLAQAIGKSRGHVGNTLRLLNLPDKVQQLVRGGALSAGHARALLTHPEPEKAAMAVVAGNLTVRQTEALATRKAAPSVPAPTVSRAVDPDTAALEQELSEKLGLRVQLLADSGGGGQLRLHYRSLDQLDGLIQLLSPIH